MEEQHALLARAHEARGHRLFAERRAARAAVTGLRAELAEARAEADRLRAAYDDVRLARDRMVASRTWRYTQPIRDTLARVRDRRG